MTLRLTSLAARQLAGANGVFGAFDSNSPLGRALSLNSTALVKGPKLDSVTIIPKEPASTFSGDGFTIEKFLSGSKGALKIKDRDEKYFVWKSGDTFQIEGEAGATRLASKITGGLVPVARPFVLAGKRGLIQPFVAHEKIDVATLNPEQAAELMTHFIADRLISNLDTHSGNFGIDATNRVIAFDKGQAFKFFRAGGITSPFVKSGLAEADHLNPYAWFKPFFPGDEPVYPKFIEAVLNGTIRVDPYHDKIESALNQAESLTYKEIETLFGAFAKSVYGDRHAAFLDAVLTRAKNLRREYDAFVTHYGLASLQQKDPKITNPKITLAQMEVTPHQPEKNFKRILASIESARASGSDIIIFPAHCIMGNQIGDRLENPANLRRAISYNEKIREASQGITVIWGNVWADFTATGHDGGILKRNAAFIAQNGAWLNNGIFTGQTFQTIPANYRGHSESRHFEMLKDFSFSSGIPLNHILRPFPVLIRGQVLKIGLTLTEDIWTENSSVDPAVILRENGADCIVNLTSSTGTWRKDSKRHQIAEATVNKTGIPLYLINDVGVQNEENNFYPHDGRSFIMNKNGHVIVHLKSYESADSSARLSDLHRLSPLPKSANTRERDIEELWDVLSFGIRHFSGPSIVPASGGLDSSVVLAAEVVVKGAEMVTGLTMPGPYTDKTFAYVQELFRRTGVWHTTWSIMDTQTLKENEARALELKNARHEAIRKFNEEDLARVHVSLQARERGDRAMIMQQLGGYILVNTNNKLEIGFGYGSIHGNWIGHWAPLGDVPKGRQHEHDPNPLIGVWDLARYINRRFGNLIPQEIIDQTPTTELKAGDRQPFFFPYHDTMLDAWQSFNVKGRDLQDAEAFLEAYLDHSLESRLRLPHGLVHDYFNSDLEFVRDLEDKWDKFHQSSFKQNLMPPIYVVSHRALGRDRHHSQGPAPYSERYFDLRRQLIGESLPPPSQKRRRWQ